MPSPKASSLLAVPIEVDTTSLARLVESALPRQLWAIEQHSDRCIAPQGVKVFGRKLKVTPPISCTIRGAVTRGAIRLRGAGQDIVADIPVAARIGAYDVGGILKGKTATGSAVVHARIRLAFKPDWSPAATVSLDHDWVNAPGIDFLGKRISFTEKADERLAPVIRRLEQTLPQELRRMNVRAQVDALWRQGFTVIELNRQRPPVWMRLTPRRLHYGGYEFQGQKLCLNLGLDALTETFVGTRPADPAISPLPAVSPLEGDGRLRFHVPVVADYRELEPVILRALQKRAREPFVLPGIGEVDATFEKVEVYGTRANRIAVGVMIVASQRSGNVSKTQGRIWLSARPSNDANSALVRFEDLAITGDTDGVGGDMLLALGQNSAVSNAIAGSLTQNFSRDLNDLLRKIRHAIENKEAGRFVIRARIDRFSTGRIAAYGQGLYLPVDIEGTALVNFRPAAR
ncbi:MAG: DUF4403 family protein [Novosphingobium sp.]|nr:MAG: DUF4403 family protein [Novosphingobium sp.]